MTMKNEQMSVASLVDEIRIARRSMSSKNQLHGLLGKCEAAVVDLANQLHLAKRARVPWYRRLLGPVGQPVTVARRERT